MPVKVFSCAVPLIVAILWTAAAQAQPITFAQAASRVRAAHDININDGVVPAFGPAWSIPADTPNQSLSSLLQLETGNTQANGGIAHSETTTKATVKWFVSTGVSQFDPSPKEPPSSLLIDLELHWNINQPFGPPVAGALTLPIGGTVGASGSASVALDIHWDAIMNGQRMSDVRPAFNTTRNYTTPGPFSDTITANSAVFTPSSFNNTDGVDRFIVRGTILFTANNGEFPSDIFIRQPANPQEEDFLGMELVPEPGLAGMIMLGAISLLARKRRA